MNTATVNVRMPEDLKRSGDAVLDREGVSITELVRRLYEVIVLEQKVPDVLLDQSKLGSERAAIERKRAALRLLAGSAPLDSACCDKINPEHPDRYQDLEHK